MEGGWVSVRAQIEFALVTSRPAASPVPHICILGCCSRNYICNLTVSQNWAKKSPGAPRKHLLWSSGSLVEQFQWMSSLSAIMTLKFLPNITMIQSSSTSKWPYHKILCLGLDWMICTTGGGPI